jgi:hypothetical protein
VGRVLGALMLAGLTLEFALQGWIWHCPDTFSFAFFSFCNTCRAAMQQKPPYNCEQSCFFAYTCCLLHPLKRWICPKSQDLGHFFVLIVLFFGLIMLNSEHVIGQCPVHRSPIPPFPVAIWPA